VEWEAGEDGEDVKGVFIASRERENGRKMMEKNKKASRVSRARITFYSVILLTALTLLKRFILHETSI
jgi:hypothetical protein